MRRLALAAAMVAFVALLATPAAAQYYGPFPPAAEDYGPGITLSGAGFAPLGHRDRATARAVGDARPPAEGTPSAPRGSLAGVPALQPDTPVDPPPACLPSPTRRRAPPPA